MMLCKERYAVKKQCNKTVRALSELQQDPLIERNIKDNKINVFENVKNQVCQRHISFQQNYHLNSFLMFRWSTG